MGIPSFLALPAARSDWADCMPCHPLGHMLLWTALLFLAPVPGTRGKCSTHILSPQQLPPRSAPSTLSGDALSECSSNPGLKQSQGRIIAPSRCLVPFFFLLLFLPGKRGMGSTMHRYFSPSGSVNHETSYIVSQKRNVLSFNCLPLSKLNHEPRQFLFQPHAKSHDLLRPSHCVDKSSTFHTSEGFRACSPGQ
uniref:Uncharacterized protein n=1 Tax=Sus scrofa TaxID=9823 RepID=A0A8D0U9W1_PIG